MSALFQLVKHFITTAGLKIQSESSVITDQFDAELCLDDKCWIQIGRGYLCVNRWLDRDSNAYTEYWSGPMREGVNKMSAAAIRDLVFADLALARSQPFAETTV